MKKAVAALLAFGIAGALLAQKTPTPAASRIRRGEGRPAVGEGRPAVGVARQKALSPTPKPAEFAVEDDGGAQNGKGKGSTSKSSRAQQPKPSPAPVEGTINTSKSNTFREAAAASPTAGPAELAVSDDAGPQGKRATKPSKATQGDGTADRIFCGDHTDTPRCCRRNGGYWVDLGDGGGCNFYYYYYRVTQVDVMAKSFTVMAKGKAITLNAAKLASLPKVGEMIDITYTQSPGGPVARTIARSTKGRSSD